MQWINCIARLTLDPNSVKLDWGFGLAPYGEAWKGTHRISARTSDSIDDASTTFSPPQDLHPGSSTI